MNVCFRLFFDTLSFRDMFLFFFFISYDDHYFIKIVAANYKRYSVPFKVLNY